MRKSTLGVAFAFLAAAAVACGGIVADTPAPPVAVVPDAGAKPTPLPVVDSGTKPDGGEEADDPWMKADIGPTSKVVVIDLGLVPPNTPTPFEIPANALGFNVAVESTDDDFGVTSIESPTGQQVHKDSTPFKGDHPTSTTIFGDVAAAGVPQSNHPDVMPKVKAGTWKLTLSGTRAMKTKIRVQNTPDGEFHGGGLDVHVYLPLGLNVEGDIVSKTLYKRVSGVRDRIDAFGSAIEQLYGLTRGNVTFHLVDAKYVSISDRELAGAFALSKVAGDVQALHVVFSEPTDDQQWWGIAGGIPGVAATGTSQSAIALALNDRADAEMEGFVLAHESGHFMGLNHTTEFFDSGFDPLEDTAQCPGMTFQNFNKCPDYRNVMAAAGAVFGAVESSPLQRRVMQGSPLYRALLTGTPPGGSPTPGPGPAPAPGGRVSQRGAPDFGRLFGHPGVPPTSTEAAVLASLCGHARHAPIAKRNISATTHVDLGRIAADTSVAPMMRRAAARLSANTR